MRIGRAQSTAVSHIVLIVSGSRSEIKIRDIKCKSEATKKKKLERLVRMPKFTAQAVCLNMDERVLRSLGCMIGVQCAALHCGDSAG